MAKKNTHKHGAMIHPRAAPHNTKAMRSMKAIRDETGSHKASKSHDGHKGGDHHAHMAADFRKRFWISLALTLPILVLSPMLQTLVGLREAIRFSGDIYVLFSLSSAVFWYGGWPFLKGLFEELKSAGPA
jgi:P-type Cu2+ transporter